MDSVRILEVRARLRFLDWLIKRAARYAIAAQKRADRHVGLRLIFSRERAALRRELLAHEIAAHHGGVAS